jgi:hypothetical protein
MNLNFWQDYFLNNFGSAFTILDTAVEVISFVVIIFLLPILLYSCQKNILNCYQELKRQNRHLQTQGQSLEEINRWMQYIVDKNLHNESVSPPEKKVWKKKRPSPPPPKEDASVAPLPASPYKKVI